MFGLLDIAESFYRCNIVKVYFLEPKKVLEHISLQQFPFGGAARYCPAVLYVSTLLQRLQVIYTGFILLRQVYF